MAQIDLNSVVLLLIGSVLTIVGGLLGTYFSQNMARRIEDRKFIREKIEEAYDLSGQHRQWFFYQLWLAFKSEGLEKEYLATYQPASKFDRLFEALFNRFATLISLYIPSLKRELDPYYTVTTDFYFLTGYIHGKSGLPEELLERYHISKDLADKQQKVELMNEIANQFNQINGTIADSLEETIRKV